LTAQSDLDVVPKTSYVSDKHSCTSHGFVSQIAFFRALALLQTVAQTHSCQCDLFLPPALASVDCEVGFVAQQCHRSSSMNFSCAALFQRLNSDSRGACRLRDVPLFALWDLDCRLSIPLL
jgi:hypothetical protein